MGKAFGVKRVVRQELQALAFHCATTPTLNSPDFDLQVDPYAATREVAHLASASVVPAALRLPTRAADCFFERRTRVMTRAVGSSKMPRTVGNGRKPSNLYVSDNRRFRLFEFDIQT